MKRLLAATVAFSMLLGGCAPNFDKKEEVVEETKNEKSKEAIIPKYQISDDYYQTLLPFQPSKARGLVVSNMNTRLDLEEFETGLMRLAQNPFPTDRYVFREGQFLDADTVRSWLRRDMTEAQLKKKGLKPSENLGLNPMDNEKGKIEDRYKENPEYLAHVLEHNYLIKTEENKVKLGGIVIGLALNSVYYYQKEAFGAEYDIKIKREKLEAEGKKIADEVVKRIRKIDGAGKVPIMVGLFEQGSKDAVVPGNFIAYGKADEGSTQVSKWDKVKEKYELFPSKNATSAHRDDATAFANFKQDVEKYFPNFNGVIGKALYVDDQLQKLTISIPMQFYGKSEVIGFTQYVAGLVMEHFPEYISVEVNVSSSNGQEALITKGSNKKEPHVYIYHE